MDMIDHPHTGLPPKPSHYNEVADNLQREAELVPYQTPLYWSLNRWPGLVAPLIPFMELGNGTVDIQHQCVVSARCLVKIQPLYIVARF